MPKWLPKVFGSGADRKVRPVNEQEQHITGPDGEPVEFDMAELQALLGSGEARDKEAPRSEAKEPPPTVQLPPEVAAMFEAMKTQLTAQAGQIQTLTGEITRRNEADATAAKARIEAAGKGFADRLVRAGLAFPKDAEAIATTHAALARTEAELPAEQRTLVATFEAGYLQRSPHLFGAEQITAPAPAGSRALDNRAGTETTPIPSDPKQLEAWALDSLRTAAARGNPEATAALAKLSRGEKTLADYGVQPPVH